jgi:hypothetical protein
MLQSLIKRAGVASSENIVFVFAARPEDAPALLHLEGELYLE